jgi:hypothetical protein
MGNLPWVNRFPDDESEVLAAIKSHGAGLF